MSHLIPWLDDELRAWEAGGLLRSRRVVRVLANGRCTVDGREAWDFASNDYLNLSHDPRVVAAAVAAIQEQGVGAKSSPLVSGRTAFHAELERALAEFEGAESAILFPTGMAANMGTVTALAKVGDAIFCDRLNHASLVDGCRLSGARFRVYRHDDLAGLEKSLTNEAARRKFIVTDGVFSMDGDLAPLPELCAIGERTNAAVIVDEAHGTGVFGQLGRGVAELYHVEDRVAVRIGTLSKAIGTLGGFVTGTKNLVDFLWNQARTQVYSTALPPAVCAAATASLQIMQSEPSLRQQLQTKASQFREHLANVGVSPCVNSVGPIIPIVLDEPKAAMEFAERLLQDGFLVGAIRPPTVPHGTSRLRITLSTGIPVEVLVQLARRIGELCRSR